MAVKVTDRAVLPRAKWVKKLETFPPGQAATINIPNAILAMGRTNQTNANVTAGSIKNWLKTPVNTNLGFFNSPLKSPKEISKAIPNITKARAKLRVQMDWASKLI